MPTTVSGHTKSTDLIIDIKRIKISGETVPFNITNCKKNVKFVCKLRIVLKEGSGYESSVSSVVRGSVYRGQPTEGALLSLAGKITQKDLRSQHTRLKEIPFSSDSKTMAVLCKVGSALPPTP